MYMGFLLSFLLPILVGDCDGCTNEDSQLADGAAANRLKKDIPHHWFREVLHYIYVHERDEAAFQQQLKGDKRRESLSTKTSTSGLVEIGQKSTIFCDHL